MSANRVKVVITGAAGQIGYALLFRIASGQMFGAQTVVDLNLLELESGLTALEGVVMELQDGAFPLLGDICITSDLDTAMTGVNWAILVGAVPRKAGMERSDLLEINGTIFGPQGQALNNHAADDVRVLVVGNPCNTNCLIAMNNAPDIANERFYAMTMLDENRAKAQLALKAGVAVGEVTNLAVWGNHSSTQYPDFYHARIGGREAVEMINDDVWFKTTFMETVQQRGAAIIKARGSSSAASAANAVVDTVHAITNDTAEGDYFSLCQCSQGQYDIEPGLIFSFPTRVVAGQLEVVTGIEHNDDGKQRLQVTEEELKKERDVVRDKGFID